MKSASLGGRTASRLVGVTAALTILIAPAAAWTSARWPAWPPLEAPTRFLTALGAEVLPRLEELTRARTANATALIDQLRTKLGEALFIGDEHVGAIEFDEQSKCLMVRLPQAQQRADRLWRRQH